MSNLITTTLLVVALGIAISVNEVPETEDGGIVNLCAEPGGETPPPPPPTF